MEITWRNHGQRAKATLASPYVIFNCIIIVIVRRYCLLCADDDHNDNYLVCIEGRRRPSQFMIMLANVPIHERLECADNSKVSDTSWYRKYWPWILRSNHRLTTSNLCCCSRLCILNCAPSDGMFLFLFFTLFSWSCLFLELLSQLWPH